ncbi:unnamed protein product [Dicrocoelium dendriticum]|nr:unnamed protein product [Dicrocoelium dendriticum]
MSKHSPCNSIVHTALQSIFISSSSLSHERQELLIRLQAAIGPRHVLFSCAIHGTLGIAVFLARELIWYTSVPQTAGVTTRTAVKTKGAAAVCFILFGSSFLFLSSHFKAHSENHHLRVNDYNNVVSGLSLPRFDMTRGYRQKGQESLDRFDVVFWAGDLNFRIQQPRAIVEQMLKSERRSSLYDNLLCSDELHLSRSAGRVFQGFDEGKIKFPPTFKLDPNSDAYDTSDKQRVPSYTDRILFLAHRKGEVTCLHYDSIRTIRSSDHRPVYGFYAVHLKPGCDNIALAAGAFHRDVYIAGNRRRALQFDLTKPRSTSHTKMCRTQ